jgi:hypothetical protein
MAMFARVAEGVRDGNAKAARGELYRLNRWDLWYAIGKRNGPPPSIDDAGEWNSFRPWPLVLDQEDLADADEAYHFGRIETTQLNDYFIPTPKSNHCRDR